MVGGGLCGGPAGPPALPALRLRSAVCRWWWLVWSLGCLWSACCAALFLSAAVVGCRPLWAHVLCFQVRLLSTVLVLSCHLLCTVSHCTHKLRLLHIGGCRFSCVCCHSVILEFGFCHNLMCLRPAGLNEPTVSAQSLSGSLCQCRHRRNRCRRAALVVQRVR